MAFFQPSTKICSAVISEICDAGGASADSDMRAWGLRSLRAATSHFNNRANWNYALTEADPIQIFAPFGVTGVSASANQTSALVPAGHGFKPDDMLAGTPFTLGTRIAATASASFTLNQAISQSIGTGVQVFSATATRDLYDLPSNWKAEYSGRLLAAQRPLYPITARLFTRGTSDETVSSTPERYDTFFVGGKGKIRMVRPPNAVDIAQLRYYRRMTLASATGDGTALDIPEDYDLYMVAWAKWHFLTDKGQPERAATWLSLAEEGVKVMLSDQTRRPDEDLKFTPGHAFGAALGNPNSTEQIMAEPW